MTRKFHPSTPLETHLYNAELDVRSYLKRFYNKNTFDLAGVLCAQTRRRAMLHAQRPHTGSYCHDRWATSDNNRKTAACLIEQKRALIWGLGKVFGRLEAHMPSMQFVTVASQSDQVPATRLGDFSLPNYRRIVERALNLIGAAAPGTVAFGIIEISGTGVDSEFRFEPHVHLLMSGATGDVIRACFRAVLPANSPGHPIKILPVADLGDLGRRISYMLKFAPELRRKFVGRDGKLRSQDNLMTGDRLVEWLSWLSMNSVDDLLISHGFSTQIRKELQHLEWATLIAALRDSGLKIPPGG